MSENDLATVLEENAVLRREIGRICAKCDEAQAETIALRKSRFEVDEMEENARQRITNAWRSERDEARKERDEALRERDEARCSVCDGGNRTRDQAKQEAIQRGWDCFKGETK